MFGCICDDEECSPVCHLGKRERETETERALSLNPPTADGSGIKKNVPVFDGLTSLSHQTYLHLSYSHAKIDSLGRVTALLTSIFVIQREPLSFSGTRIIPLKPSSSLTDSPRRYKAAVLIR